MRKRDPLISIGKIASRSGMAVSAIRFYSDAGLLPFHRNAGGHRVFQRSVIRRVSFILIAQQLGYSLSEIHAQLLMLPEERTPTKADWARLSRQFKHDIENKIQRLQNLQESLDACIGCGCLSLKSCRLYNPDDKAISLGKGPRYLMGNTANDI